MESMSEESTNESARYALPPASFAFLVLSLRAQCEAHLGFMNLAGFGQKRLSNQAQNRQTDRRRGRQQSGKAPSQRRG